jgi:hypothetical protein
MIFNPHKLGIHKVLQHIPLNAIFDAPYQRALKKAVNIADLRIIAKSRAHKVRLEVELIPEKTRVNAHVILPLLDGL